MKWNVHSWWLLATRWRPNKGHQGLLPKLGGLTVMPMVMASTTLRGAEPSFAVKSLCAAAIAQGIQRNSWKISWSPQLTSVKAREMSMRCFVCALCSRRVVTSRGAMPVCGLFEGLHLQTSLGDKLHSRGRLAAWIYHIARKIFQRFMLGCNKKLS